jgi:predicted transcriptional regulator
MEDRFLKIKGHEDLVKDTQSGAILNINRNETVKAKERKKLRRQKAAEYQEMKQDVNDLKNDMNEIKNLLGKIAERV